MNYRITTDGREFRIEAEVSQTYGWFKKRVVKEWYPVDRNGNFPEEDYDVALYATLDDAYAALRIFVMKTDGIKRHEWTPVENQLKIDII